MFIQYLSENIGNILFSITVFTLIDASSLALFDKYVYNNSKVSDIFKSWCKKNIWIISMFLTPIIISLYMNIIDAL